MLDKMKAANRHFCLMIIVAAITYALTAIPTLDVDPLWAGLFGCLATTALAYFTPLTRQYGVGSVEGL